MLEADTLGREYDKRGNSIISPSFLRYARSQAVNNFFCHQRRVIGYYYQHNLIHRQQAHHGQYA